MEGLESIQALIPHRPPFLWVDRILCCTEDTIQTEKDLPRDLDVFTGHYPGNPIAPGVLLCEAIFQSGALLMAKNSSGSNEIQPTPVLTRIANARFKRAVFPGDTLQITVKIKETLSNAVFFNGKLKVAGSTAVQVEFACSLLPTSAGKQA